MKAMVEAAQDRITQAMSEVDGQAFREDHWQRPGGGGGRTRVLQDGHVFEKAGVNTSAVHGELNAQAAVAMRARRDIDVPEGAPFYATGISLVLHPRNPMAPTVHANYRYFELMDGQHWWFGGGADLTPSYLFSDDAAHFHQTLKAAADRTDPSFYPRFKAWCDEYFFIPHRGEARGVGGVFYDDLADRDADALLAFQTDMAGCFVEAYRPIIERRKDSPFTGANKAWQQLRRGRYVEFNLVWDRGTTFGLKTGARTESVLMSLPLTARWEYDHVPSPESPEGQMLEVLKNPREWA